MITLLMIGTALLCAWSTLVPRAAAADTVLADDGFDRTLTGSWGSAPTGGSWSVQGGSALAVGSSASMIGGVQPGQGFRAQLASVSAGDVDVWADAVLPAATQFYYTAEARRQSDGSSYRGRLRVDGSQNLNVEIMRVNGSTETILVQRSLGVTVAPGDVYRVELSVSGTASVSLAARVYRFDQSAPGWQLTTSDSSASRIATAGTVGIQGYLSKKNSATDVLTRAFRATSATAPTSAPTSSAPPSAAPTASAAPTSGATPPASSTPATSGGHGAATVGTARYAAPGNALYVSSAGGSDSASGTIGSPLKTVGQAVAKATAGQTIVLRGGSYHESIIVPPGKPLTIQNYPGEAAWFDGSRVVSGFVRSGSAWSVDWGVTFDSSATYTRGAPDGTAQYWQFINAAHPLAAHPDQVWIDDTELTQVGSLSAVGPGTFFADYSAKKLYLGSDPGGRTVRASDLIAAISLRAPGTVVRGIGVRRYADSVPDQGVITSYQPNMTLENVEVRDSATGGIGMYGSGCTLRDVTVTGSGQLGIQGSYADGLVIDNALLVGNNDQHFNDSPAAGAIKITTSRGVTIKNSEISGTDGSGVWLDESVYDATVVHNDIHDNSGHGVHFEISSTATIADNVVARNDYGIWVANSDSVNIWNNTVADNTERGIAVTEDNRRITQLSVSGHDKRRSQPDSSMPWISRNVVLGNNILSTAKVAPYGLLTTESYEHVFAGNDMITSSNGNVFAQPAAGTPANVVVWSRVGTYGQGFGSLAAFASATGRDRSSLALIGSSGLDAALRPTAAVTGKVTTVAQPLPSAVAAVVGQPAGTRQLGAWR